MDTNLLITTLNFIAPLSAALEHQLIKQLRPETYEGKHLLLQEGQVARRIWFINKGFARAYYHTPEGRECTVWFMGEGDLMISVYSFYTQQPARETIELVDGGELLSMSWAELQAIYAGHPEFNYIGRKVTEKYYILAEERAILLRTLTGRERYEKLLANHPDILQKASLSQIASYLSITPETLSRIRAGKVQMNRKASA
ncbi:Crp/Fnr family transcriptional regulator [Mucilaginibacter pedocola]|uniref:Cyclic nucleotide-binding domain-containing protein n=1 Tax=Mucilaginibacter pedocola TaxID=1792845 RepID=A0A1S9PBF8_9SPHI|nr:Crp/Fnr family transcriptional regulator [Mucilaginibacter pedocola]OOQ58316.1 hypothetical protein BC343_11825 [Mucilaginibacter pedocola]